MYIADTQKAAKEAFEDLSARIFELDKQNDEEGGEKRLYCCDLHSIPISDRNIPPVPKSIEGKTEFDQPLLHMPLTAPIESSSQVS